MCFFGRSLAAKEVGGSMVPFIFYRKKRSGWCMWHSPYFVGGMCGLTFLILAHFATWEPLQHFGPIFWGHHIWTCDIILLRLAHAVSSRPHFVVRRWLQPNDSILPLFYLLCFFVMGGHWLTCYPPPPMGRWTLLPFLANLPPPLP